MRAFINLLVIISVVFTLQACHEKHGWIKYSSNEDGFTIYLPAAPLKSVKQEMTAFGKQAVHYVTWKPATFDINKLKLLQVSYTDCPRRGSMDIPLRNAILNISLDLIKKDFTESELQNVPISIEGYPAMAFIFDDDKETLVAIVKACIANNRIYFITAVVKKDYPTNNELNIFFNSFQVLR